MYEFGIDFVARCIAASAKENITKQLGNVVIKVITKEEYDSIEHDGNTVYYVVDGDKVVQYLGSDNITIIGTDYTAGDGININPDGVISIDADYGASLEMTIDPDTYVITTVLKDQNGNTLGQAQTIDLPLESVVVSGRYDTATKTIILTLEGGSTISIPVGDLVSGLESESNKVTSISSSSTNIEYPSAKAVYDLVDGIETLPASTASDEGKVLTVDVNGDAEWVTPAAVVTDYDSLANRPAINGNTLTGDKTGAQLGLVVPSDLNSYLTIASAASTYQPIGNYQPAGNYLTPSDISDMATQTWVGQQGFLTSAREVPTTLAEDAGKVLTATGAGAYQWNTVPIPQNMEVTTNKVTSLSASSTNIEYPSAKAVYDVIQNINEVPDTTPAVDTGKVLTVDGTGNAVWSTPSTGVTDYTLLNNKPSINNVELNGNKTAADLGLVESSELNNYLTTTSAANTYQTKADMANYLTTTDAATLYQPKGVGVGKNVDGTSFTLDGTTYTANVGCEAFNYDNYSAQGSTTNKVSGNYSHAEGVSNTIASASGVANHAEGISNNLTASGGANHIEGVQNTISGSIMGCHVEGAQNTATQVYCHVEGAGNTASGSMSHAQGLYTVASGAQSMSTGMGTIAAGQQQVAIGKYNVATANDDTYPLIIGNGTSNNRSDCFKVDKTGKIYVGNNPNGVDVTAIKEVPDATAADAGKVLTATGADTYEWAAVPTPSVDEVPDVTSTDDGKVLTASYSGGTGSYSWQTPTGGGLQVETDGTNYWITVNGIRLYFADSAPTGTIPDGSMGIGW